MQRIKRFLAKSKYGILAIFAAPMILVGVQATASAAVPINANGVAYSAATGAAASFAGDTWTLSSGHGVGGGAQIDLINPGTATTAPTFTADTEYAGNPRWVIEFHNGNYLFGNPAAGSNASNLNWTLEPGDHSEANYAAALTAAQAGGADDQVTSAFIVLDIGNPNVTVHLTDVTYNGHAVVQGPKIVFGIPPFLYGGHVISVNNNRVQVGWNDGPGVHYVLARTFGLNMTDASGQPHYGFTGITTGYWSGLAPCHGYDIELIPAGANRQPLPNAHVGWIFVKTTC